MTPSSSSPSRNHISVRGRTRSTVMSPVRTLELVGDAERAQRRAPSMAEYLDALRACLRFGECPGSPLWERIEEVALRKTREQPQTAAVRRDRSRTDRDGRCPDRRARSAPRSRGRLWLWCWSCSVSAEPSRTPTSRLRPATAAARDAESVRGQWPRIQLRIRPTGRSGRDAHRRRAAAIRIRSLRSPSSRPSRSIPGAPGGGSVPYEPIVPLHQLRAAMTMIIRRPRRSVQLDVEAAVEMIAEQRPLDQLPG